MKQQSGNENGVKLNIMNVNKINGAHCPHAIASTCTHKGRTKWQMCSHYVSARTITA